MLDFHVAWSISLFLSYCARTDRQRDRPTDGHTETTHVSDGTCHSKKESTLTDLLKQIKERSVNSWLAFTDSSYIGIFLGE